MQLSQIKCITCRKLFLPWLKQSEECDPCWRKSMNKKEFHFGG